MTAAYSVTTTDSKSGVNFLSFFSKEGKQEVLFYTDFPKRDYSVTAPLLERWTVFVQDLGDVRLALREPLAISIEQWPNSVTACSYDTGEFAVADDELNAIDELKALIVDLYFLLKEEQNNLGPLPLKYWNFLKSIIQEK